MDHMYEAVREAMLRLERREWEATLRDIHNLQETTR